MDPNEREERVMDGLLVIAMNKHREICTIQSSGGIMLLKDQVSALINVPLRINKSLGGLVVKNSVLSLLWLMSDLWLGNSCMPWPEKKRTKKTCISLLLIWYSVLRTNQITHNPIEN